MKKSVFTLLALAIASVSVFTSCDKNDDGYGQTAKTETTLQVSQAATKDVSLLVCVSDGQAKYSDMSLVLDIDGKEMTVDLSQMKQVSKSGITQNADEMCKIFGSNNAVTYSMYLGKYSTNSLKIKSIKTTPKAVDASELKGQKVAFIFSAAFDDGSFIKSDCIAIEKTLNSVDDIQEGCNFVSQQDNCNRVK